MTSNQPPVVTELRMHGETARIVLEGLVPMLKREYRGLPLWSICGHVTGHGSGYSIEICKSAGLDPYQKVTPGKPLVPSPVVTNLEQGEK